MELSALEGIAGYQRVGSATDMKAVSTSQTKTPHSVVGSYLTAFISNYYSNGKR